MYTQAIRRNMVWVDRVSNPEPTPNSEILREQAHPLAKYFGVRGRSTD